MVAAAVAAVAVEARGKAAPLSPLPRRAAASRTSPSRRDCCGCLGSRSPLLWSGVGVGTDAVMTTVMTARVSDVPRMADRHRCAAECHLRRPARLPVVPCRRAVPTAVTVRTVQWLRTGLCGQPAAAVSSFIRPYVTGWACYFVVLFCLSPAILLSCLSCLLCSVCHDMSWSRSKPFYCYGAPRHP